MEEFLKVLDYYKIPVTLTKEKVLCPFHADKNASLMVDVDKNFWHCFGCQESGDAYKFHKQYQEKVLGVKNDLKIAKLYSQILNGTSINSTKNKLSIVQAENKDRKYYRQKLIEAKDFYRGLKTVDWQEADDECVEYMLWRGFKRSTLNKSKAKYTYNDFSYPIIFPILDNGKFKGWVCRTFDEEIGSERKYLYNTGFRRNNTIAGNYRNTKVVMLVEGYMDKLKANQLGVKNVGAILGWKITNKQIEKLKAEGVEVIISALDNDTCGKNGTKYLTQFFDVIPFNYPDKIKDMGDMTKEDFVIVKKQIIKMLKERNLEWEL